MQGVREGCSGSQGQHLSSRAGVRGRGWCWVGDYLQLEYEREGVQYTAERIQGMVGGSRIENE